MIYHISNPTKRTNLPVKVEVCQGKFNSLPDLLLLHVHTTNISVCHIGLLIFAQHRNRRVGLGRKDVNESVGVTVESDRGGWLELFAVERGQNADNIIRAGRGLYDTGATNLVSNHFIRHRSCVHTSGQSLP